MLNAQDSRKISQSASAIGAGLLGFGVGAKWGATIDGTMLLVILITGAIIHVGGMYIMQMKEGKGRDVAKLLWISAWLCLLALIGMFIYMAFGE